jgi:hypothetical protein
MFYKVRRSPRGCFEYGDTTHFIHSRYATGKVGVALGVL